jgi:hypothetical protein
MAHMMQQAYRREGGQCADKSRKNNEAKIMFLDDARIDFEHQAT